MEQKLRLRFQKGDILAVTLVLVLAAVVALLYIPGKNGGDAIAAVYQNGELVGQLPLSEDQQLRVEGSYINVITIRDGKAAITQSDCPGEDCVHSGAVSVPGRSVVCLPNGVEVRIISGETDVDFIVG